MEPCRRARRRPARGWTMRWPGCRYLGGQGQIQAGLWHQQPASCQQGSLCRRPPTLPIPHLLHRWGLPSPQLSFWFRSRVWTWWPTPKSYTVHYGGHWPRVALLQFKTQFLGHRSHIAVHCGYLWLVAVDLAVLRWSASSITESPSLARVLLWPLLPHLPFPMCSAPRPRSRIS